MHASNMHVASFPGLRCFQLHEGHGGLVSFLTCMTSREERT